MKFTTGSPMKFTPDASGWKLQAMYEGGGTSAFTVIGWAVVAVAGGEDIATATEIEPVVLVYSGQFAGRPRLFTVSQLRDSADPEIRNLELEHP